jgi:serine/threonine-protein kinase
MSADQLVCPSCHTPLPEAAAFCYVCGTPTPTGTRADGEAATTRPSLQSAAAVVDVRKRLDKALGTNFTVGDLVGRGGFAEVFSVRDNRLKRELAVKVLSPELVVNQPMLQRFRREAEAVAALRHAGIVPIYDIGESGGIAYIMMPLIKGETLKKRLDRDGRLPISEVRRIIKEIATALSVAHDAGLVHRDIKPENVMLEGPKQQILVMDFGIAKALDPDQTGMTSSGLIVGTPHFMSPEQASGEAVDARSDQYSLAVLGYRMVTGAHPFDGETTRALLYKQVFETPPPARERFPDIPQSLSDALHRGMAKDPKDRYATMDDFAAAVLQEDTN